MDDQIWTSQFGFRKGRSTLDAIFVARRRIEAACAQRFGHISLLALDWRKAFDSINVDALSKALSRFGLPQQLVDTIEVLLKARTFFVQDHGSTSTQREQSSGVSQGCTLSPLLFVIVMTMVMRDATKLLKEPAKRAYERGDLADIVYADDTLLLGVSKENLQ